MPLPIQTDLAPLLLLSDVELWKVANTTMDESQQTRLEELADLQKQRPLNTDEQVDLDRLMVEAQYLMLRKAEARRILAQRGHTVFSTHHP